MSNSAANIRITIGGRYACADLIQRSFIGMSCSWRVYMSEIIAASRFTSRVENTNPFFPSVMMLALSCQSLATTGRPAAKASMTVPASPSPG